MLTKNDGGQLRSQAPLNLRLPASMRISSSPTTTYSSLAGKTTTALAATALWISSYSVARFANDTGVWTWEVLDEPYPPDVQDLGVCDDAVVIQDGDSKRILLTMGKTDVDDMKLEAAAGALSIPCSLSNAVYNLSGHRPTAPSTLNTTIFPRCITYFRVLLYSSTSSPDISPLRSKLGGRFPGSHPTTKCSTSLRP
ncbi:hypothetical protein MVEN_01768700 [Mycena venus]|uniref:Uncharacterized protein n=1 Tax=Mycena venus TaxID=2733690 RepID=A0A8H6XMK1_9AGAR|nr:hypothetical protein MVEN_01768700 [Mycena venus]